MIRKRTVLPPLDYLLAFESAARRQSFAAASRDLNISQTAISRKVRLLEQHYDVPLFFRGHRSIRLTPQGHAMYNKILPALESLRDASREMFSDQQRNTVTLAATNSVATLWLMPRLRKFNRSNRHLKIMLVASDSHQECLAEDIDLTILRGDGNWPGYRCRQLFGETVFPVCSPGYLATNPAISSLPDLPAHDLIEVSSGHPEWMNWETWLAHSGVTVLNLEQAAVFNTYPLAIEAALNGLGVAMGWAHLVDHLLDKGQLVRPVGPLEVRTSHGYYLLRPENRPAFAEQNSVEDWLMKTSAARRRYRSRTGSAIIT